MAPTSAGSHQSFGFRTLKGIGSRLVIANDDDSINKQTKLGVSGWKDGLIFDRTLAWQLPEDGQPGFYLYRVEAIARRGLASVATGHGRIADHAWLNCYRDLAEIGMMPRDLYEAVEGKILKIT